MMNLLGLLLPMWVSSAILSTIIIDARSEPAISAISEPASVAQREPTSQFSLKMEAESPGVPKVRVMHHQDLNKRILIALIVASILLGGILLFSICFWIYRWKNSKNSNEKGQKSLEAGKGMSQSPMMVRFNSLMMVDKKSAVAIFDYQSLEAATNNFHESNVLGEGSSGRIYKARFDEKSLAAVRRIDGFRLGVEREFEVIFSLKLIWISICWFLNFFFTGFLLIDYLELQNEVNCLSKIRHQNIIELLGYCINGESRFLVYEMVEKASLETQLHGSTRGSGLTWHLRMKIAVDVARGLEYLHEHSNPPVVHRDIKSSNILLDSNYNAKLSDFLLAVTSDTENKNIKLSGTSGYLAPEYLSDGKLTDKSDVYAFGVVLLELLMGRKPLENDALPQCQSIVTWAIPQLTDRSKLPNIVDPVIKNTMDLKHLYQVAAVAVLCVQPEPCYRPLITDVLHSLIPLVPCELGGSLRVTEPAKPGRHSELQNL
ncbi:probable receptor-like protein kinase At1g80640 isoform X1 [Juglans microcarpa x Juglans regia]|uniref:probable receptor-like protein kinase At1g80640 isoform X1 n=1 Tax=Juglans microcarpa x Juglans regia TaxID=2249226 RepID=UPI001B7E80E9|nr:probable receptor-like protein kinase At1g80640 isoform X1 [Juglans microcarpa x Juglans regia]XP_041016945.1 probable receptor-like protein kinase At1g80640 isoform X1 [Juglans microcarpa x Juglans regia]